MYSKGYGGGWGGKGGPRQESKGSHITDITDLKSQSNPVVNNHTSVINILAWERMVDINQRAWLL